MAKKSRNKCVIAEEYKDIKDIWNTGILQSFCFNTVFLLILALIVIKVEQPIKAVKIDLSFTSVETEVDAESVSILPEQPEKNDILEDIIPEVVSDEPELLQPDVNDLVDNKLSEQIDSPEELPDLKELASIDETLPKIVDDPPEPSPAIEPANNPGNQPTTPDENNLNDVIAGLGLGKEPPAPPVRSRRAGKFTGNNQGLGAGKGGDEFDKRLAVAGAQTGDIQISIAWDDVNDIDVGVYMTTDFGGVATINFQNKLGPNMGMLDIDMNAIPTTNTPVENIFWPPGRAPDAHYIVYVHHYRQWCPINRTNVRIRIKVDGKVTDKQIQISPRDGIVNVFRFDYVRNQ
jgi:hypothetical protein